MTPAVSCVCLTSWPRRAGMLAQALAAYANQGVARGAAELVVVNDGAPLRAAAAGVVVVNVPPGRSIGRKRTDGMEAASGRWLATWDDDDVALPWHLAAVLGAAERAGAAFARSSSVYVSGPDLAVRGVDAGGCFPTAVVLAAVARAAGGWPDVSYGEDHEFLMRVRMRRQPAARSDVRSYVHRRHGANVSTRLARETLDTVLARARPVDPAEAARVAAAVRVATAARGTLVVPA